MIYLADEKRFEDLKKFCRMQTIYSCRIMCLADSYGLNFDFVDFWLQYDENGSIVSAISRLDGAYTVQTTDKSNIAEIKEFLEVIGFSSVLSQENIFPDKITDTGVIMSLKSLNKTCNSNEKIIVNPDLNSVYRLLKKCSSKKFTVPDYEDFILDMSHKVRHNMALCVAVQNGDDFVSAAMTVSQSESTAIIGAVATDKDFRRCGYGTLCVVSLAEMLGNRKIFIMRDRNENEKFYKSIGFENAGSFFVTEQN